MDGVKRTLSIVAVCFSLSVFFSLLGCAGSTSTVVDSSYEISFDDYSTEMLEETFETLPGFIDANSSVVDVYGSADQETKQIRMSMVVSSNDETQIIMDANTLIDLFPERVDSVAYLHALEEGDSNKALVFQALNSDPDNKSAYSIYEDYRLIVHVGNEDGSLELYGIREPGHDELVLWQ